MQWQVTKVKSKKEAIEKARKEGRTVHFATSMDLCHLKNSDLEQKFQKYNGRVVLQGDVVKDDSGSYAVFKELPRCAGQACDAVSAYTQVKIEDVPIVFKLLKSECTDIWIRLPQYKVNRMAKH